MNGLAIALPKRLYFPMGWVPPSPRGVLYDTDPELGGLYLDPIFARTLSLPGRPAKAALALPEVGICLTKQHRPIIDAETGNVIGWQLIGWDFGHNERVDDGAAISANRLWSDTTLTANGVITAIAIASAAITATASHRSLGSASAGVSTNEHTGSGLARATATQGTYTAPASLGAVYTKRLSKLMTASATVTAYGSGVFDSLTVAGSNMYNERPYATNASLVNLDTLTTQWDLSN